MQVVGETLFLIAFSVVFVGILWLPITWLILSIFTPKKLLEKYFKEPHFSLTETVLMAQFPGFLIRTGIFAWLALIPSLDKKRNIKNVKDYMPVWYSIALQAFIIGVVLSLLILAVLLPILLLI